MIKTWQKKPENGGNTRNRTLHLLPGQKGLKGTTFGPGYPGTPGHLTQDIGMQTQDIKMMNTFHMYILCDDRAFYTLK